MKKWKKIYEIYKQSNLLDDMDLKFIEISEKILATNKPFAKKLVYSKLWLESWIQSTQHRLFLEQCIKTISKSNIEII